MTMTDVRCTSSEMVRALERNNFYSFIQGAFAATYPGKELQRADHIEAMCFALQDVQKTPGARLMISVAPRHLKSFCGSIAWPAFLLGHQPNLKIMVVSYGGDLARELANDFRSLMMSPWYRNLFPDSGIDPNNRRYDQIKMRAGGNRLARSLHGAVTGFGADVIVIDDLAKASDMSSDVIREQARRFFDETLYSRLDDKRSARIVSLQQRLHPDDFPSYLIEKGTFDHLCLPSIATEDEAIPIFGGFVWERRVGEALNPAREPLEELSRIKAEIGAVAFQAQYQQDPTLGTEDFLSVSDLCIVDTLPPEGEFILRVQSWDTAVKDGPRCSYSVGMTFGWHRKEEQWYLLDVHRGRHSYSDLKTRICFLQDRWSPERVIIEDTALGIPIIQELRQEGRREVKSLSVKGSKLDRFLPVTDWIKQGGLKIPKSAPWFADLKREMLTFPRSAYNDQVDALSQFNRWRKLRGELLIERASRAGK